MKKIKKNSIKLSRYAAGVLALMLGVVLNSAAQYDFMGIRYKGDTVEIPRAKPYKSDKSIPSLDFSIDSIRPLDELVTGNGEAYPWLSLDGNRIYYIKGCDYGWFNTGNWFDMSFENGDVTNCTKYGIFNYVPQQKTELSITGSTFESNNIGIGQEQGVLTLKCNHI